ncbi:MAG: hypothetical protein R2709_06850 [Marmoricola sp.]
MEQHPNACKNWAAWKSDTDSASAWIFARPVDEAFAQTVISAAQQRKACTTNTGGFGPISYSQTCPNTDGGTRIRHASLIGQTWFTCEISAPPMPSNGPTFGVLLWSTS